MNQILFFVLFLIMIGLFSSFEKMNNNCVDADYLVIKIDSVKNWYLIDVSRNDSIFKIVSIKTQYCDCSKISLGKRYNFDLERRLENVLSKNGLKVIPLNYSDVSGVNFDPNTDILIPQEKGINGIYVCKNLKGLCYF
jgi:hypothetical protein